MYTQINRKIDNYLSSIKIGKAKRSFGAFLISVFCLIFLISIGYIILFPIFSATSAALKTEAARFDATLY